jgi:hypothetical protein
MFSVVSIDEKAHDRLSELERKIIATDGKSELIAYTTRRSMKGMKRK